MPYLLYGMPEMEYLRLSSIRISNADEAVGCRFRSIRSLDFQERAVSNLGFENQLARFDIAELYIFLGRLQVLINTVFVESCNMWLGWIL